MADGSLKATSGKRYRAFLSYSSKDRKAGKWLHSRLEGYVVPKPLREANQGAKRIRPVFRDREELAAGRHLPEVLNEALQAADYLVVLCSPHSADSEWVGEEIATFKALSKGDRIIPVIAPDVEEGDPSAVFHAALGRLPDGSPDPVNPMERLGADLRASGDGKTDGVLKVVAGLLGVGFNDVKRREREAARRRTFGLVGLVATFFLLAVGAAGAAYVALDRNEKLQDALVALLDGIVTDVEETQRLASRGEIPTAEALRRLANAERQVNIAFGMAPDNVRLLREEARLRIYFSRMHRQAGSRAEAQAAADRANAIMAQVGAGDEAWMEAASLQEAGDIALAEGRADDALAAYERLLEITRASGNQRAVSVSLERIADVKLRGGDASGALAAYEEGLAIARELAVRDGGNLQYQRDVSVSLEKIADVKLRGGDASGALAAYEEGLAIRRDLVARDGGNLLYQSDLANSYARLAQVAEARGDWAGACQHFTGANATFAKAAALEPGNVQFRQWVEASTRDSARVCAAAEAE